MGAAELFGPEWMPLWVTGLALLALAIWLFLLDVSNVSQRLFALLLALRGLTFFLGPLRFEAETARMSVLWANVAPYAIIPVIPLVIAFLSLYPRRRGLARVPGGMIALFLLTVALEGWYFLDHSAYATVVSDVPARYDDFGPLFVLTGLRLPILALAGFVLAADYKRAPTGSFGFSLFLMVAAFTLNGLFDGTLAVLDLVRDLGDPSVAWDLGGWSFSVLPVLALPLSMATCIRLLPTLRLARTNPELQEISRFFFIAVPLAVLTAFTRELPYSGAEDLATFVLAVWRLAIPLLLAYALMRYQLFNIDVHLKAGVRRAIILGAFTVTFFLVSEAAESMAEGDRGPLVGIVGAGLLALGSRPVQNFAGKASDKFMPDTKPIAQQTYAERLRFYLDQYLLIRHDGETTHKERQMLDRLAATLALPAAAVQDLEATGRMPDHVDDDAEHAPVEQVADTGLEMAVKGALAAGTLALVFGMLSQGIENVIPLSNQVAGLLAAAAVSLLLGPLEDLADRLTHRLDPSAATDAKDEKERRQAFETAYASALEDGSLSSRDLVYLASLQQRLRISWTTRWRLERRVRRNIGA